MTRVVGLHPSVRRWHGVGLTAYLLMLGLYAGASGYLNGTGFATDLSWLLGAAALIAGILVLIGCRFGWQDRRDLLIGWPVAALVTTVLTGIVEPDATRTLPGTITITFAYVGLTCPRWRSLLLLPLGIAAFVVGGVKDIPGELPTVAVTAVMWILVAEVPAWLISRLEAQSAQLRQIAQTDALTQVLDRSTLTAQLATHGQGAALVLIDLDDFKDYNDRLGHAAGDDLLVQFAAALRSSVRQGDMVFRLGGDEFLLLLLDAGEGAAENVLAELHRRWADVGAPVSFSAGIATGEQDPMRIADQRMYHRKRSRGYTDG